MKLWVHNLNFQGYWLGQDGAEVVLANPLVEKKGCLILGMTQVCLEEQGSEISTPLGTSSKQLGRANFNYWLCVISEFAVWGGYKTVLDVHNLLLSEFMKSQRKAFQHVQTDYASHETWPWPSYLLLVAERDNSSSWSFFTLDLELRL